MILLDFLTKYRTCFHAGKTTNMSLQVVDCDKSKIILVDDMRVDWRRNPEIYHRIVRGWTIAGDTVIVFVE